MANILNPVAPGFDNAPSVGDNIGSQFSGIFSLKPTAKYASGARSLLKVNGRLVGFAFNISWRIDTSAVEITTIDDYMPYELAPQRVSVSGTMSALHIPGQGIGVQLWQPDLLNFLTQEYITIEVRDSHTDQLLFYTNKAMITSRQEDIKVDSLASVQLSWRAIGFQDERTPEIAKETAQPKKDADLSPVSRAKDAAAGALSKIGIKF